MSSYRQLRPIFIVLELAPLTPSKLKDDKKTHEIQNLGKIILAEGRGGLSKMAL